MRAVPLAVSLTSVSGLISLAHFEVVNASPGCSVIENDELRKILHCCRPPTSILHSSMYTSQDKIFNETRHHLIARMKLGVWCQLTCSDLSNDTSGPRPSLFTCPFEVYLKRFFCLVKMPTWCFKLFMSQIPYEL